MSRSTINFQVDSELKAAFAAAAAEEAKAPGQILREFVQLYVERRGERVVADEIRRQSQLIAERAADPASDEAAVMRWVEEVSDSDGWTA